MQPDELGAVEALAQVRAGRLSATRLVEACLERIALREAQVQAWVAIDADGALARARAIDAAADWRGLLPGIPVGVKDVIETAGLPTAYGSPIYAGHRPKADAACIALLRAEGGIVLGKTVTAEFATTTPGATRNPWNPAHTPGGSSSGSAAAVADRMVPLACGTQTSGSVLRPAAFCGVVGFNDLAKPYDLAVHGVEHCHPVELRVDRHWDVYGSVDVRQLELPRLEETSTNCREPWTVVPHPNSEWASPPTRICARHDESETVATLERQERHLPRQRLAFGIPLNPPAHSFTADPRVPLRDFSEYPVDLLCLT